MRLVHLSRSLLVAGALASCARPPDPSAPLTLEPPPVAAAPLAAVPSQLPPAAQPPEAPPLTAAPAAVPGYPWLADPGAPVPAGVLVERFAPPPGFQRVELVPGSFGAWLRALPLAPEGTPVRSFRGGVILPADHESLAAVAALDVGTADLQQCADSVIRLHAEWLFAQGRRDASYRAASGTAMPFERWARGERMVAQGLGFTWAPSARPDAGHASYRRWLDGVFNWANTGSLARYSEPASPVIVGGTPTPPAALRPRLVQQQVRERPAHVDASHPPHARPRTSAA